MNFKNVRLSMKFTSTSRYNPWRSSQPPAFGFPNNPWDNLDPKRMNKDIVDEYDKYN